MNNPRFVNKRSVVLTLSTILILACVTVNVNFPEGAVQKATDDYVKELYRAKEGTEPDATLPAKKTSWMAFFITDALAADLDGTFKVNSPKTREIQSRQAKRLDEIAEYKKQGLIGENAKALLTLKASEGLKPLLRKKIENLLDDENSDRKDLYKEVININGLNSNALSQIEKSFSRSFQLHSPAGTWIEIEVDKWQKKP